MPNQSAFSTRAKSILLYIFKCNEQLLITPKSGVKKSKNFHLSPRASTSKFLLVLLPNNLSLSRKNILALNFLLVRRTLGENICLSCLKFNLSWAPGQVFFYPCKYI